MSEPKTLWICPDPGCRRIHEYPGDRLCSASEHLDPVRTVRYDTFTTLQRALNESIEDNNRLIEDALRSLRVDRFEEGIELLRSTLLSRTDVCDCGKATTDCGCDPQKGGSEVCPTCNGTAADPPCIDVVHPEGIGL